MATSTIKVKAQGYSNEDAYQFRITANLTGNISGNSREVEAYLDCYAINPGGYEDFTSPRAYILINGTQKVVETIDAIWPRETWVRLAYWKGYVTANQTITVTGRYHPNTSSYSYMPLNQNNDVSVSLKLDGVASKLTSVKSSLNAFTPTITKYVSSYYDRLKVFIRIGSTDTLIATRNGVSSGTTYYFTENEQNLIYQTMNSTNRATSIFELTTFSDSSMSTKIGSTNIQGEFEITDANPIFENFTYRDSNSETVALTGNDQKIVLGKSNLEVTISNANKATAQKSATMKNYLINSIRHNYLESGNIISTFTNFNKDTIVVSAIDSRGNATTITKSPYVIEYFIPTANATNAGIKRENNTGTQVIVNFSGTWFNSNFGVSTNSLNATYRYKISGSSEAWTEGTIESLVIDGNNYSFDGAIKGDAEDNGFLVENSYDIEIFINDVISQNETKFSFQLIAGDPAMKIKGNQVIEMNGESLTKQELLWEDVSGWEANTNIELLKNVTDFSQLYVIIEGEGTYISCPIIRVSSYSENLETGYVRGSGTNVTADNNYVYTYVINAQFQYANPRVLTLVNCGYIRHNPASNHNDFVSRTPNKIIGVR